jgi:hypothetical protein
MAIPNSTQTDISACLVHPHFQGGMTSLKKDFYSKLQLIGFTTYRIKAGIAHLTLAYQDHLNLQSFLKEQSSV